MLQWWAEFRDEFSTEKDWQGIISNNKDVRINNAPVFYKTFFESGIICVNDLLFDLNNLNSYNIISKRVGKHIFYHILFAVNHILDSNKSKVTHANTNPVWPTHHACAQPFHPVN